jgi:hypothetical protein
MKMRSVTVLALVTLTIASVFVVPAPVRAQMPDLSQMSGRPLPVGDLPVGTVSVRVIRGALSNNLPNVDVRLEGGPQPLTMKTDASGRAIFANVLPGPTWRASATVDGQRLESMPFTVPAQGGLRMLLVAGLQPGAGGAGAGAGAGAGGAGNPAAGGQGAAGAPGAGTSAGAGMPSGIDAPPVQRGTVTIGGQSRFVVELGEQAVEVYCLFDLANTAAASVMPDAPIVFEMPPGAEGTTVLEGSTPTAKADGRRVTVTGPFAPGSSPVQIAYRHVYEGPSLALAQVMPLRLGQLTVIVRKVSGLSVTVPNSNGQRDVPLEGRTYLVVNGTGVDAGKPVSITLTGLPHHREWPQNTALALSVAIVVGGLLMLTMTKSSAKDLGDERALRARRKTVFEQLVSLERRRTTGKAADEASARVRREELLSQLEELDERISELQPPAPLSASSSTASDAESASASGATATESRPAASSRA